MAARHRKKTAEGGYVRSERAAERGYGRPERAGGNPEVIDEAEERKRGGKVKKEMKGLGKMDGEEPKHHMGRKKRASGGGVGSDSRPFSSAKRQSSARASND